MDIALTKEERAFAEQMRGFFRTEIPAEIRAKGAHGEEITREDIVTTQRILNAHGYAVPHWPVQWGGRDWSPVQRHLCAEEMAIAYVPPPVAFNVAMIGPVIATFGSEQMKQRFLPPTANLDIWWSQGFSEPNAGSDLASLKTAAVRDGDSYIVNGQKTWTTLAQCSDWIFCLVRTDPHAKKQRGISMLLIDMSTPGVTVRPIRAIHGRDEFCEVFFDDVVVPASRMLGAPGDGWRLAMDLLPFERSTCFWHRQAHLYARFDALLAADPEPDDAALGAAWLGLHTFRARSRDTQRRLGAGGRLGPETSVDKVLLASAEQLLYDTARDLLPGIIELGESPWRTEYLYSRAATIYGGTAEIQRNIIARRLLGLGKE